MLQNYLHKALLVAFMLLLNLPNVDGSIDTQSEISQFLQQQGREFSKNHIVKEHHEAFIELELEEELDDKNKNNSYTSQETVFKGFIPYKEFLNQVKSIESVSEKKHLKLPLFIVFQNFRL